MEYKLNSFKTFKDNWVLVVCGMIIALFGMLLPMTWGASYQVEEEIENFDDSEICPVELYEEYGWDCVNRLDEWYPWELNEEWNAQEMPILTESESHQRFIELAEKYNLPADLIWHTENYYWLKEWTILCIAITETSWWTKWYWKEWCWNYWNVANNDRGDRRCFANQWAWLAAIWATLNNDMLKNNQTIACLHWAWDCIEANASWYRYATSKSGNRWRNMVGCFYSIYQEKINQSTFNLHERN